MLVPWQWLWSLNQLISYPVSVESVSEVRSPKISISRARPQCKLQLQTKVIMPGQRTELSTQLGKVQLCYKYRLYPCPKD